jgi:hypothetical protein
VWQVLTTRQFDGANTHLDANCWAYSKEQGDVDEFYRRFKRLMAKNVEQEHKNIGWDDYISVAAVTTEEKGGETYAVGI